MLGHPDRNAVSSMQGSKGAVLALALGNRLVTVLPACSPQFPAHQHDEGVATFAILTCPESSSLERARTAE